MASYGTNIVPNYSFWSTSGSITKTSSSLTSSENDAYAYYTYVQTNINLGGTARIITPTCTGEWYLVLYFFNNDETDPHSYCMKLPTSGYTFIITLPSISINNIDFRVVHRGTESGTIGTITFQYENTTTNTAYIDETTLLAGGSRTFRSVSNGRTYQPISVNPYYTREYTVAVLCVTLDEKLNAAEQLVSIYVSGTVTVASFRADSLTLRLYFGDRLLAQNDVTLATEYRDQTFTLDGALHSTYLNSFDLVQNVPIRVTVSLGPSLSLAASTTRQIFINTQRSFVTATGPIVLNEVRSSILYYFSNFQYDASLMSMCAIYDTHGSRWPGAVYYTSPSLPCKVFSIPSADYEATSDQEAIHYGALIQDFEDTVKKVRIVQVLQIDNVIDPENVSVKCLTSGSDPVWYYVVLTTSNQLQVRNSNNAVLFTIASNVVDFDATSCGLYGQGGSYAGDNALLFMGRIQGFTVFYTTGTALYVASYPKYNVEISSSSYTPTLAGMGIYTITTPTLSSNITAISVSALYQVSTSWRSDGVSTTFGTEYQCTSLYFGISFFTNTVYQYYSRIAIDIPLASDESRRPVVSPTNVLKAHMAATIARYVDSSDYGDYSTVTSWNFFRNGAAYMLGRMVTNNPGNLSHGSSYGLYSVGNMYMDTFYETHRDFTHSAMSTYVPSWTNAWSTAPSLMPRLPQELEDEPFVDSIICMLPSGDVGGLYFGQGNPYSYQYARTSQFFAHFYRGLLPRIPLVSQGTVSADMAHDILPASSTLTYDSSANNIVVTAKDSNIIANIASVQALVTSEAIASTGSYTTNTMPQMYYRYVDINSAAYIVPSNKSSNAAYYNVFISELAPCKNNMYRPPVQDDFIYTGWTLYARKSI